MNWICFGVLFHDFQRIIFLKNIFNKIKRMKIFHDIMANCQWYEGGDNNKNAEENPVFRLNFQKTKGNFSKNQLQQWSTTETTSSSWKINRLSESGFLLNEFPENSTKFEKFQEIYCPKKVSIRQWITQTVYVESLLLRRTRDQHTLTYYSETIDVYFPIVLLYVHLCVLGLNYLMY